MWSGTTRATASPSCTGSFGERGAHTPTGGGGTSACCGAAFSTAALSKNMGNGLSKLLAVDMGVQMACFCAAAVMETEKFYDLSGSLTYVLLLYQSVRVA